MSLRHRREISEYSEGKMPATKAARRRPPRSTHAQGKDAKGSGHDESGNYDRECEMLIRDLQAHAVAFIRECQAHAVALIVLEGPKGSGFWFIVNAQAPGKVDLEETQKAIVRALRGAAEQIELKSKHPPSAPRGTPAALPPQLK